MGIFKHKHIDITVLYWNHWYNFKSRFGRFKNGICLHLRTFLSQKRRNVCIKVPFCKLFQGSLLQCETKTEGRNKHNKIKRNRFKKAHLNN